MGVCTREWKGVTAGYSERKVGFVMATPCTKSLGGGSGGHKRVGDAGLMR